MMICIGEEILDLGLKAQHIHLFLQMIKRSNNGTVSMSQKDFREATKCKDTETVLKYLNALTEAGLINYIGRTNKVNTYTLNEKYYFYR